MADSPFAGSPPKCSLFNLTTGEEMGLLFNPTQLTEKIGVSYNRVKIPGLSHTLLQFSNTENRQIPGVEFYFDRMYAQSQQSTADIMECRAFLRALTVPVEGEQGVTATAPPRTLFVWPSLMSIECVITNLTFAFKQFSVVDASVMVYTATCDFEEILDVRVTSDEVRKDV